MSEKEVKEAKKEKAEKRDEDIASTAGDGAESAEKRGDDAASPEERSENAAAAEKPTEPDWKTLYALTLADFDNYKKRALRDREDTYRYAEADILKDVLPAVDNLQLALKASSSSVDAATSPGQSDAASAHAAFVKGVQLVYDTLLKSLKDHGAEPFDSVGLDLDPERMEAIATLPDGEIAEGKVSIESKKGWMLKGKVLRAAQVVVSSGKPGEAK